MPETIISDARTDADLVERGRAGERDALEELFRRHWGVARRVAQRLLSHDEDAQDAAQDAMVKALRHLHDFDGRSGFRTWLLRIVTNAALDAGRSRKRRPLLGLVSGGGGDASDPDGAPGRSRPTEPGRDDDPALGLRRQDLRRALDRALGSLAEPQRHAFVLFAEAGLSYEEIAEVQGVPKGTVMSRLHYARARLQKILVDVDGL